MKKILARKALRLAAPVVGAGSALAAALSFPILAQKASTFVPMLAKVDPLLIAYTFAQTAPESISEMSTEVTGFATTLMPAWLVYVVFALIASLGIWLIGRAIGAMRK